MLLADGPQATTVELARIMVLEAENAQLKKILAMAPARLAPVGDGTWDLVPIDDGSSAAEPANMLSAIEHGADEAASDKTPVDTVVDLLDKRLIVTPDRARLRKALDKADAPQGGRAGADAGLGRAIGRPAQFDVGHGTGR
jgi:hypothetical protein